jgi:HSP20 family protein
MISDQNHSLLLRLSSFVFSYRFTLAVNLFAMNINEGKEEYIIYVAVPGIQREDIGISIKNKTLTVSAAKKEVLHYFMDSNKEDFSNWTECFTLPTDADTIMTAAIYRNGELQIHIPKGNAEATNEVTEVFVY